MYETFTKNTKKNQRKFLKNEPMINS